MSSPIRRDLDVARLAARERRLRLVMQILRGREAEYRRSQQATPVALRQSIAGFGEQLGQVHQQQAELQIDRGSPAADRPTPRLRTGRFTPHRPRDYVQPS